MHNGFIKIPRSLLQDPLWKDLPLTYRHIFITILENVVFKKTIVDDFGKLITLQPGQMITTYRRMVDLCDEDNIDRCTIERALKKFTSVGFSRQETGHRKTILTIIRKDILELIETSNETNSRQTRDIKEESEEVAFTLKKESEKEKTPAFRSLSFKKEDFDGIRLYCDSKGFLVEEKDIQNWLKKYDLNRIISNLGLLANRKNPFSIKLMESALKEDYAGEAQRILQNRNFAFHFKNTYRWNSLTITQQYCRCEDTGDDLMFKLHPETFEESLCKIYTKRKENYA